MTDPIRKEALQLVEELGQLYPTMRLGQLLCFICTLAGDMAPKNIYDVEDEELVMAVRGHLQRRSQTVAD